MRRGKELQEVGLLRDASILIEDGIITEIGSTRRLDNLKRAATARVLDARNLVIVPGLLDAVHHLLPRTGSGEGSHAASASARPPEQIPAMDGFSRAAPGTEEARALHNVARRLERELRRLFWTGSTFVQFRLAFPATPELRSRILRNLLQLSLPRGTYRTEIHFAELPKRLAESEAHFAQQLSTAARGYWKRLEPSLAVSMHAAALADLEEAERLHAIRWLRGRSPCFLTSPQVFESQALLEVCIGGGCVPVGPLPAALEARAGSAWRDVPWILPASELSDGAPGRGMRPREAIDSGMKLALASGYDVNLAGYASPFAAWARLRQEERLAPEEILHLSIANLACALGVRDRLGSIEAGHDGNLTILECDDYREIGEHLGFPPVLAVFRRGALLERRLPARD